MTCPSLVMVTVTHKKRRKHCTKTIKINHLSFGQRSIFYSGGFFHIIFSGSDSDISKKILKRNLVALELKLSESGGVAFDRLRHFPLHRIELHAAGHSVVLGADADE